MPKPTNRARHPWRAFCDTSPASRAAAREYEAGSSTRLPRIAEATASRAGWWKRLPGPTGRRGAP